MTREQFIARAVREAENRLHFPRGWWGTWQQAHGPNGERVFFSNGGWTVVRRDGTKSRHDSRIYAFKKATAP